MHFELHGRMTPEEYKRHGQGWESFYDRIAEHFQENRCAACSIAEPSQPTFRQHHA